VIASNPAIMDIASSADINSSVLACRVGENTTLIEWAVSAQA
jgi:hypothetical protein